MLSLWLMLLLLIIIGLTSLMVINQKIYESFQNEGLYPVSVEKPILHDVYKVKEHPALMEHSVEDIYTDYPLNPAKYTESNNRRYWKHPTNGTCSPPDFCKSLYQ